jgi:hypothetical protein
MLAALAITAGAASVWGQQAPATPVAPAAPPAANITKDVAQVPALPKAWTPRQMAEGIVPILRAQKTPWQLYPSYEKIFTDFADKEQAQAPANTPSDPHAKRAVQLRMMAALLASMGEQAKVQVAIKRGRSALPPEQRQSAFLAAGTELTRLLAEFVRLATALPQGGGGARP